MRILGGVHRGRRIQAPPGMRTRPMLARVREAMFSTLAPWLPGARVLDLFAGSGSLGLEALSRGADRALLVEEHASVVDLLHANLEALGLEERADAVRGDALDPRHWGGRGWADVVFLDPPYPMLEQPPLRRRVFRTACRLVLGTTAPEGVVVFHTPRRGVHGEDFDGAREQGIGVAERDYGSHALWYLQRRDDPADGEPD